MYIPNNIYLYICSILHVKHKQYGHYNGNMLISNERHGPSLLVAQSRKGNAKKHIYLYDMIWMLDDI